MKTKLSFLLFLSLSPVFAQNNSDVYNYFNAAIDEAVAASNVITEEYEEEKTNFVYSRLFTSPVLYSSILSAPLDAETGSNASTSSLEMDEARASVIDGMMLDLYASAPSMVEMTEDELRSATTVNEYKPTMPTLELSAPTLVMPENVAGGMKTNVVKPNYWKVSGRVALKFTQNYISGNWFQGGESNKTMLAEFDFDLNYDDKDRITFTNHFDFDLGFATTKADTLHSFRTNTDRLRIESTFGYKLVKNLDISAKMKLESQSLPNYPVNSHDFVSNFMAPFDANFSIGLNYKPTILGLNPHIFFAPLSAYNYKFVRYGDLISRYGIREGRHHKEDFGTQLVVTVPTVKIFKIVDFWSRAEYYTNYARAFFQLETNFNVVLSKYFKASLMLNARFDDSAPGLYDDEYGYWQIKELMTLGVTYSW